MQPPNVGPFCLLYSYLLLRSPCIAALISETYPHSAQSHRPSPAEIGQLKRSLLRHLGVPSPPPSSSASSAQTNAPHVPPYLWQLYQELARLPRQLTARHIFPDAVHALSATQILLTYNLSSSGLLPEEERVREAVLFVRAPLGARRLRLSESRPWGPVLVDSQSIPQSPRLNSSVSEDKEETPHSPVWLRLDASDPARRPSCTERNEPLQLVLETDQELPMPVQSELPALVLLSSPKHPTPSPEPVLRTREPRRRRRWALRTCRRWPLYVDFRELNWADWILAPGGFSAWQCGGECEWPLPAGANATNHALVQSLIHSLDPGLVPAPCCVPTTRSTLSILYIDLDQRIVIKNYPDMIVQGCGCR